MIAPEAREMIHLKLLFLRNRHMWKRFWIILALLILGTMAVNRHVSEPLSLNEDRSVIGQVFASLLLLSFLLARSFAYFRSSEFQRILKYAAAWAGIFLVVTIAYSYRFELSHVSNRVLSTLLPGRGFETENGKMSFQISGDGHFYIQGKVNGVDIRFLADTGASDIVLTPKAAERLGFDTDRLSFDRIYQTANGTGRGATVQLNEIRIGEFRLKNIQVSVNKAPMRNSLLGMRFFNRLKGYTVKNGILTLEI